MVYFYLRLTYIGVFFYLCNFSGSSGVAFLDDFLSLFSVEGENGSLNPYSLSKSTGAAPGSDASTSTLLYGMP